MRKGISITVTSADRVRLDAIVRDRNSRQKHVWRARIVLLTADGKGITAITQAVGRCVPRHRNQKFIRFLDAVEREMSADKRS
jgi:hypothetical protein